MLIQGIALALATLQIATAGEPAAPTRGSEALSLFGTADDDRTLVYIAAGPPATRTRVECPALLRAVEVWTYAEHPRLGAGARLVFSRETGSGEFRYWTVGDGDAALIAPALAAKSKLDELAARKADCAEAPLLLEAVQAVRARQGDAERALAERDAVLVGKRPRPAPSPKPAGATDLPAGATPLPLQKALRFPEMAAGGMRMELSLMVERARLSPRPLGDETFFGVDVAGEVRKGARVVDDFRYRFDFPASSLTGSSVPLQVERELAPGDYTLKVRVSDLYSNAGALLAEKLTVPAAVEPSLGKDERAVRDAAREAAKASAAARAEAGGGAKGAITLVPPLLEVATGRVRLETRISTSAVAYAEFYLDGVRVLTKRRPPFEVDVDLGEAPRKHVVKVIGYGVDARVVSQDELTLNEGREAFRVRIASPAKGRDVSGPTRVVAELSIPGTRRLKQLELFLDETRAAVLYKPPFEQTIDIPSTASIGFLRAVATLDDGTSAEDVRYLNAPPFLSEVNVNAVDLYTAVFAKGRPVTGLSRESFRVLEDGLPQDLQGFEVVTKLPLALGLALDTSTSMDESMKEVQKAATQFLKDLMTPKDRCFLVTFADAPRLASGFTTDREHLAQVLGDVRAEGMTALWDALQSGLFQFQGIRGRKAYVLLTDGDDSASKNKFETVLDYAKKSGVAVYFIGMKIPVSRPDIRFKLSRVAKETGGAVYHVESARGLPKIYRQIDEELRSQYLLSYVPKNQAQAGKWRKVEVKVSPGDLTARTIAGYYP